MKVFDFIIFAVIPKEFYKPFASNVDPVNESLIQDAITELAKNRTVLVIAHHVKNFSESKPNTCIPKRETD